jgi:hypothetical protein
MIAGRPEADVLAEAITPFALAHGVEEFEIREPGVDPETPVEVQTGPQREAAQGRESGSIPFSHAA